MDILEAIAYGKWDVAKDLISKGVDINAQDKNGNTVLHLLCFNTNLEMMETLLKAGADPNKRDKENMTPLFYLGRICFSVPEEKYQLMKLLLDYGADKNIHCVEAKTVVEESEKRGDTRALDLFEKYEGGQKNAADPSDPDELYDFIDPVFDEGRYLDVIDAITAFPEDKMTQKLVNMLAAAFNNTKAYKKAIALIQKHKHLYKNQMYKWYYYAAYAYEDLHQYKNTLDCIEAGIAECDRQKEGGILTDEEHTREVNSLLYLKKFCPEYLGGLEKRTYTKMDKKLFNVLRKFYVNDNWKHKLDYLSEPDRNYLVSTGYPAKGIIEYTHDECIKAYKDLLDHPNLTMDNLIAAYVCGFSSFPRGRQPILSYLFARAVPVHKLTDPYSSEDNCSVCNIPGIRNVCLGERIYREYRGYSWNEGWSDFVSGLQEFAELEPCTPTDEDIKIFNNVIDMIRNAPVKETPGNLETRIKQSKIVPGYEKYRFRGQLITLAELGVMPNPYIKPLYDGFTPFTEAHRISNQVPGSPRSEVPLPLSGWRGDHPLDEDRLKLFFGRYLTE